MPLRPLTARSAVLSVLLGAHPPAATIQEIVAWGLRMELAEPAVRMAVSRMVSSGELVREGQNHVLAPRFVERQRRQDQGIVAPPADWDGQWHLAVVTTMGLSPTVRARLREVMEGARFGRLRDGVWMRPDNLTWRPPEEIAGEVMVMSARPDADPVDLAARLFDLETWAARGRRLLTLMDDSASLRHQVTVAAAVVRHLTADPLLPSSLEPSRWPGHELRLSYSRFRDYLIGMRSQVVTDHSGTGRPVPA